MADVSITGVQMMEFIDRLRDLTVAVTRTLPSSDCGRVVKHQPERSQFEAEQGVAVRLLAVKAAVDFESDELTGACLPGWHEDFDGAFRAAVRELRELVRDVLRWDVSAIDREQLRRKAAAMAAALEAARENARAALLRFFEGEGEATRRAAAEGIASDPERFYAKRAEVMTPLFEARKAADARLGELDAAPLVGAEPATADPWQVKELVDATNRLIDLRDRAREKAVEEIERGDRELDELSSRLAAAVAAMTLATPPPDEPQVPASPATDTFAVPEIEYLSDGRLIPLSLGVSHREPVWVWAEGEWQKHHRRLTVSQFKVLKAVIDAMKAGRGGLSLEELTRRSGVTAARDVFNRLREDPLFSHVVPESEGKGRGTGETYKLVCPPRINDALITHKAH